MEELKMNRGEIFNFVLRRWLYFTWCNNLFVNDSKVCVLPEISLHIYQAITLRTFEETETPRMIRCTIPITVQILWPVNLHNISQFSLPVSCRFMDGKVRENVEALFTLFSKYELFVYGIEMWTKTACLIYFLFDLCGLKLPAINDAPVRQCILFRFDGNLYKIDIRIINRSKQSFRFQ